MKKKLIAIFSCIFCIFMFGNNITYGYVYNDIAEMYNVSFRDSNGKNTNKVFKKYDMNVYFAPDDSYLSNTVVTLPKPPRIKGFQSLGWTTVKNGKKVQYKSGDKVNITRHTRFYLVKRKSKIFRVTFLPKNGKNALEYRKLLKTVEENSIIRLPKLPGNKNNSKLYKNTGWSLSKNQKKANYSPKTKMRVRKNMTFYASWTKR